MARSNPGFIERVRGKRALEIGNIGKILYTFRIFFYFFIYKNGTNKKKPMNLHEYFGLIHVISEKRVKYDQS